MCEQHDQRPQFWLFTFGFGHTHPLTGESLANKAIRFEGTYRSARAEMVERFGVKWAFQYASGPGPTGIIESALTENQ